MTRSLTILLCALVTSCAVIDGLTGESEPLVVVAEVAIADPEVVTGDFNADGIADLAVGDPATGKSRIYLSRSGGLFDPDDWSENSGFTDRLWVANLDSDLGDELISSEYDDQNNETELLIFSGPVDAGNVTSGVVEGAIVATASGLKTASEELVVLTKNPSRIVLVTPHVDESATVTVVRELDETGVSDVAVGYLDEDGWSDLVYGHDEGFSVLYGSPDGFGEPIAVVDGPVLQVEPVDINEAGADELVLLHPYATLDAWAVTVVEFDGTVLTGYSVDEISEPVHSIHLGEVDGEAPIDVVVFANTTFAVQAALEFTGSTFDRFELLDIGAVPRQILVADFTGDGRADVATVTDNAIVVYRNNL